MPHEMHVTRCKICNKPNLTYFEFGVKKVYQKCECKQLNAIVMEDVKKVYFSVNSSKLQNEEKLNNQINSVINFITNRHKKSFKKATFFIGYDRDDYLKNKFTLEIKFYL